MIVFNTFPPMAAVLASAFLATAACVSGPTDYAGLSQTLVKDSSQGDSALLAARCTWQARGMKSALQTDAELAGLMAGEEQFWTARLLALASDEASANRLMAAARLQMNDELQSAKKETKNLAATSWNACGQERASLLEVGADADLALKAYTLSNDDAGANDQDFAAACVVSARNQQSRVRPDSDFYTLMQGRIDYWSAALDGLTSSADERADLVAAAQEDLQTALAGQSQTQGMMYVGGILAKCGEREGGEIDG